MSSFTTRAESDVLVVQFETPAGLNDFRNNALRDSALRARADSIGAALRGRSPESRLPLELGRGHPRRPEAPRRIQGGKIVFYRVQPVVRDLLAVMKLDRFFTIADDEPRAIASLRPSPYGLTRSFASLDTLVFLSSRLA